jgi:hypothetical protein
MEALTMEAGCGYVSTKFVTRAKLRRRTMAVRIALTMAVRIALVKMALVRIALEQRMNASQSKLAW